MLPASIATSVAPETISKVTRLFNGSARDVLNELLQNARRAGAGTVAITTTGTAGDRLLTIADDGTGIDDPASVVTLGQSGWSAETRDREDPAGMGVFSLAGRDVMIRSWSRCEHQGWCAHIPAGAWESSSPIAITSDPIIRGTSITIRMPEAWAPTLDKDLGHVVRFYPLPVTFNGAELPREEWLAGAAHVEDWSGSRIGIFRAQSGPVSVHDPRLNFHGVTIPCALPRVTEVGADMMWTARVEIIDTPSLQLVLPARKEAVQNAALDALQVAVKTAMFRAIAQQPTHRLPYDAWAEACALGVPMPEAEADLQGWVPRCADAHTCYVGETRISDPSMVVMGDFEAIIEQPFAAAVGTNTPFGGPLVEEEPEFAGYSWYDTLARVDAIDFLIERDTQRFAVSDLHEASTTQQDGFVDAITMVATVIHAGARVELSSGADIAFAADDFMCGSADETLIFVRQGMTYTSAALAELLERAVFDPSSDSDADSHVTQRERFERAAMERAIGLLEGSEAALVAQIRRLLGSYSWIIPSGTTVAINATRDRLDVQVGQSQPEAA